MEHLIAIIKKIKYRIILITKNNFFYSIEASMIEKRNSEKRKIIKNFTNVIAK